jgi:hypothetical protein
MPASGIAWSSATDLDPLPNHPDRQGGPVRVPDAGAHRGHELVAILDRREVICSVGGPSVLLAASVARRARSRKRFIAVRKRKPTGSSSFETRSHRSQTRRKASCVISSASCGFPEMRHIAPKTFKLWSSKKASNSGTGPSRAWVREECPESCILPHERTGSHGRLRGFSGCDRGRLATPVGATAPSPAASRLAPPGAPDPPRNRSAVPRRSGSAGSFRTLRPGRRPTSPRGTRPPRGDPSDKIRPTGSSYGRSQRTEDISTVEHAPPWPKQGPASYFPSIEKKYGRSIAEWQQIIAGCGLEQHMAIVGYLKSEYGVGHGHANALVAWTLKGNVARS